MKYIQIFLQFIIQIIFRIFLKIFFNFKITGIDEVTKILEKNKKHKKGIIFAANHISEWDSFMIRFALPFILPIMPFYYVSMTKEHYRRFGWRSFFYGGFFFKLVGAYPAYTGIRDYQVSLINHIQLLEKGNAICIFPEGKMGPEHYREGEAKGGVGFLSEYTKTNIIPVQIKGLKNISWSNVFRFKKPIIEVIYKVVIHIKDFDHIKTQDIEKYKFISESIMKNIWK